MSALPKVLVCGASPDRVNNNAVLRNYVARGFEEALTEERVMATSLDYAVDAVWQFRPDLLVVFGSCMPDSCDYTRLRTYCVRSNATLVFWLHDDPYEFDFNYKIYNYADMIFTNDKWAARHFNHPRVAHLPLAADSVLHFRKLPVEIKRDLFFCGVGFQNRRELMLESVPFLNGFDTLICGAEWPELPLFRNKRINNDDLPDYYASSRVTLNIGRKFNLANSKYQLDPTTPGPRTFEAALAGAVQCYYFDSCEILEYFEPESEIILFDSPKELVEIIENLKEDAHTRNKISRTAQERALKDHTYAQRAKKILDSVGAHTLNTQSVRTVTY